MVIDEKEKQSDFDETVELKRDKVDPQAKPDDKQKDNVSNTNEITDSQITLNENLEISKEAAKLKKSTRAALRLKRKKIKEAKRIKYETTHVARKLTFAKLKGLWPFSKTSGRIFLIYLLTVLVGGWLLSIPGIVTAHNDTENWNWLTGVFTASSAFSDTGISLISAGSDYSLIGQIIIIILIQIGGLGIITIKITILALLRRRISYTDQTIAYAERGSGGLNTTREMVIGAIIFIIALEVIGAILLTFAFYFIPQDPSTRNDLYVNPHQSLMESIWFGTFHSISATNNAGFDIISGSSLIPYDNSAVAYLIQIIFLIQWVVGGFGFPTFYDIYKKIKAKKEGKRYRFSLFTKLNFTVYMSLFILGPFFVFLSEYLTGLDSQIIYHWESVSSVTSYTYQGKAILLPSEWKSTGIENSSSKIFMDIFFNVTACRNAGFSSVDINGFNGGSKLIMSGLMFIGSAPSSTAGGIRTTTFAIIALQLWATMRSKKELTVFKRKVPIETAKRSLSVLFSSIFLVGFVIIIVYVDSYGVLTKPITQPNSMGTVYDPGDKSIPSILMLVASAFGTVGFNPFTSGIVSDPLNPDLVFYSQSISMGWLSQIALIFVMFIGQVGISNSLLAFVKSSDKQQNLVYLEEDVAIG